MSGFKINVLVDFSESLNEYTRLVGELKYTARSPNQGIFKVFLRCLNCSHALELLSCSLFQQEAKDPDFKTYEGWVTHLSISPCPSTTSKQSTVKGTHDLLQIWKNTASCLYQPMKSPSQNQMSHRDLLIGFTSYLLCLSDNFTRLKHIS